MRFSFISELLLISFLFITSAPLLTADENFNCKRKYPGCFYSQREMSTFHFFIVIFLRFCMEDIIVIYFTLHYACILRFHKIKKNNIFPAFFLFFFWKKYAFSRFKGTNFKLSLFHDG